LSRFRRREHDDGEEHDVSKELFLGIMMLMLCLGIMILNVAQPVWRVHQHDPELGDVVVVYTADGMGLSEDGYTIVKPLQNWEFKGLVESLVTRPQADLHLFRRGGSRERLLNHAAHADSMLSTGPDGKKTRPAVYIHTW
jgi:hypothetical protein